MDKERFDKGLAARKAVLGEAYVDKALANSTEFSKPFQEILTEYCWGGCWGDDTLSYKQRSLLNLGMLAALGRMHEWGLHFKGAITNGLTKQELQAIITQISIYCGVPAGVECHRIANQIFAEMEQSDAT